MRRIQETKAEGGRDTVASGYRCVIDDRFHFHGPDADELLNT